MQNLARILGINIFILLLLFLLTPSIALSSVISDAAILQSISKALEVKKSKTSQNNGIKITRNSKTIEPSEEFNIQLITPKINKKLDQEITNAHEILKKGYYEIAVQTYKNLHQKYPKNLNISFALGYSYHKLNQFEKAKRIYYKLISSDYKYKNKVINNILDIVTSQTNGNAFYMLKKLATENSNNPYILSVKSLGSLYYLFLLSQGGYQGIINNQTLNFQVFASMFYCFECLEKKSHNNELVLRSLSRL